jgi:hypothetical protein
MQPDRTPLLTTQRKKTVERIEEKKNATRVTDFIIIWDVG